MARYTMTTKDRVEFKQALKASDYFYALWDIAQYLRGQVKYNDMLHKGIVCQEVRDEFYQILEQYGINLNELE